MKVIRGSLFFFFFCLCLFVQTSRACVDDDARLAELAAQQDRIDISACVDILAGCNLQNQMGEALRTVCCQTCSDNDLNVPPVENELPPPDENSKLQVFLLAGQSECTGQASVEDLEADSETYPELQGNIPGVWFAGYSSPAAETRFFIAPMEAGGDARSFFGPEISFGERIYDVTGKRTLVMKYCVGGTNVHTHWNPDAPNNRWDTALDDGTSQWMSENAGLDFTSKFHLFKNIVYTIRRTNEALTQEGIPFEWAGIIWVQGQSDLTVGDPVLWKAFGENTARVWEGFREAIGSNAIVPIIDTGGGPHNQLKSGKVYATQIVKGCNAKNVETGANANDDTSTDCVPGPTNPCGDSPNMHLNTEFLLFYGFDPLFSDEIKICGLAASLCKEFHWYVKFPTNLHSAYEGMILKARMLANAFIEEFTDYELPSAYANVDPAIQFPSVACKEGELPSSDNFCYIDYIDESLIAVEQCTTVATSAASTSGNFLLSSIAFFFLLLSSK